MKKSIIGILLLISCFLAVSLVFDTVDHFTMGFTMINSGVAEQSDVEFATEFYNNIRKEFWYASTSILTLLLCISIWACGIVYYKKLNKLK